jgi:hypothetical protein
MKAIPPSLETFAKQIQYEFVEASAIASSLFAATVQIASDTEQASGGEVSYPIHSALNWTLVRFGYQARTALYAALLLNEDGATWQAKLSNPRWDSKKGRSQKYETPVGNGSRAFLACIPTEIRQKIAERYGVEVPFDGSFWSWLQQHSEIPIVITEGGKKALSLLSQGCVAIALYGAYGGYHKLPGDTYKLIADIEQFASEGREITLAFDQDTKPETRSRVNSATNRFGGLLTAAGCNVSIAQWDGRNGLSKGVDDLIVSQGVEAWEAAYREALPLEDWRIWQRLSRRLTWNPSVRLVTSDLSTLHLKDLPEQGMIAIAAGKGTGKTKLTGKIIADSGKALGATHRICLGRNLCERWGLDYRGDLDKVGSRFINGSSYTLRIGFCVDSLLAIDPQQFVSCDLVIDEVVQVVRHLLTSSTCAKDGKRPALLARFRELIKAARRVIVADADLDNATIHYIKALRGDEAPVFLIRNDYQSQGYLVKYLESSSDTTALSLLLEDIRSLEAGKALFVATDNLKLSKSIAAMSEEVGKRVLLINSKTSGADEQRAFIATPDAVLGRQKYDVVVATPSLATGVSIEIQGVISKVYGIFTGVSTNDADMAQALGRVREPVERIVWCTKRGGNFSKVSRSANPIEVKANLLERTSATVMLVRSGLREDIAEAVATYDWQADPHINLYCRITADQNFAMQNLRTALRVRLQFEGNRIIPIEQENLAAKELLTRVKEQIRIADAQSIVKAPILDWAKVQELETREGLSPEQQIAIARYHLCEFYAIKPTTLTLEQVLWDKDGRTRGELLELENLCHLDVATDRTVGTLEKQFAWGKGLTPWDVSNAELRSQLRKLLGLEKYLDPDREWSKLEVAEDALKIRELAQQVKVGLNFTVSDKVGDVQVINQLLRQLGLRTESHWSRSAPGLEGEKVRVYRVDRVHWDKQQEVLQRRADRRERLQQADSTTGSPPWLNTQNVGGDPDLDTAEEQGPALPLCKWGSRLGAWEVISVEGDTARVRSVAGYASSVIWDVPARELQPLEAISA